MGESMPRGRSTQDSSMLAMALVGYEMEKKRIEDKIKEIRARIGASKTVAKASAPAEEVRPRRRLSAAARKRIAAAQKKRWAEHRKAKVAKVPKEETKK
jgi:hypothetical protein